MTQGLLGWANADASRESLQLALYTWMVWVSICLIGAWVGLTLRQISDYYLEQARNGHQMEPPALAVDTPVE